MTNTFTFKPINSSYWIEHKNKDWILNPADIFRENQKWLRQQAEFRSDANRRNYRIFKIEPVQQGKENYTLIAFPNFFPTNEGWGNKQATFQFYDENFYVEGINWVEKFAYQVSQENLKVEQVPFFRLTSQIAFQEKRVGEVNYFEPNYPEFPWEKKSEVREGLTDGMNENDLILIAPIKDYKVEQVTGKINDRGGQNEQEDEPPDQKKPDQNNHQCQTVHDKLYNWETKARAQVLNNCQNDIHAGYYDRSGNFFAPEYAQYTVLTKKCSCGGQLKGNHYGDQMTKCGAECSGDEEEEQEEENDNNQLTQIRISAKRAITRLLRENNLKTSDLPAQFHNWKTDLSKLDNELKINQFQSQLEAVIQNLKKPPQPAVNQGNNGLSWPVKILIGGGVVVILVLGLGVLVWWRRKKSTAA